MIELNALSIYQWNNYFCNFIVSFFVTFCLVPLFSYIARAFNIFDVPDKNLKRQETKIPYLGGLAIFFGFFHSLYFSCGVSLSKYFIFGLILLLIVGLIDDLIVIKPYTKLIGQCVASILFINSLFFLNVKTAIYLPLVLLWFLSIINSFNLIDVMDGLSTTIALAVSFSFFLYAVLLKYFDVSVVLCAFIGALLGFFYYNKPPAKIYMGDSGSLFIGGFLAYVPFLFLKNKFVIEKAALFPILVLLIPILELVGLILIRTYKRIPFYLGSPDHFSIYLQQKGWSKNFILIFVLLFAIFILSISLLFVFNYINSVVVLFLLLSSLAFWCLVIY